MSHISTNERLDRIERMVGALHPKLNSLIRAANLTIDLELENMADFKDLADQVTKIKGTVNSTKAFIQGLKARIEELAAGFNDTADQAAIMALAAELGGTETELAAAIAANPDPGVSTGGIA
jgi:short-subunit dehydrogenase involved in D-alanine esterification of teichoic acids